jgi:hypothetical protein
LIDESKKGFSGGKAVIGGALLGVVGLAAGFMGKKKALYQCVACGFSHEYDGVAEKNLSNEERLPKGYKNTGLNSVWIDSIRKATPDCVFCGKPQNLYIKQDGSFYSFICAHCFAEFRCSFSFGGKVKAESTQILNCGEVNQNHLSVGSCEASILIKNADMIK